jgi:hypothetical protein
VADQSQEMVLLKDTSGNFYALSIEMIEKARVPDEQRESMEQLSTGDVSGFAGLLLAQAQRFDLAGSFRLSPGGPGAAVFAAGYYFQFGRGPVGL